MTGASLLSLGLLACGAASGPAATAVRSPAHNRSGGHPASGAAATVTRGGWRVTVRPVALEAGPTGLVVSVAVAGPVVIDPRNCSAPLSAWLVDRAGRRVRNSIGEVRGQGVPCRPAPPVSVPKGSKWTLTAVIPAPIPAGAYTVRGVVRTAQAPSGEPIPGVAITWPWKAAKGHS